MNIYGLVLGVIFVVIAVLMSVIGITDVSHNTEAIIMAMMLCAGGICLSIGGLKGG